MSEAAGGFPSRLQRIGTLCEDFVLALLLIAMIGVAATQIILRNFFDSGFVWADEFLRLLVLWLAMAGAVAASRVDRHISIDVVSRFLPPTARALVAVFIDFFTAAICALLGWHSLRFLLISFEDANTRLNGLPAWWFEIVLPVAFALMTWRYLLFAVSNLWQLLRPAASKAPS